MIEFTWIKPHIIKNAKDKKKLDMFMFGITYISIFDYSSDFDIYIGLGFWQLNISKKKD
jgi:hypothetical protein